MLSRPHTRAGITHNLWTYFFSPMIIRLDGYTCQMCGSQFELGVHHCSYEVQIIETLITLCKSCHKLVHNSNYFKSKPKLKHWKDGSF